MKLFLSLAAITLSALSVKAITAVPWSNSVNQPDGTKIDLTIHGDEFFHYTTTTDGYTVSKNQQGFWVYSQKVGERVVESAIVAHDVAQRNAQETQFLASLPKYLTDTDQRTNALNARQARHKLLGKIPFDLDAFKGLVILVNYNDYKFAKNNANDFFNEMINKENYEGYNPSNYYGRYTGSVHDFFYDNSMGLFSPHFDIVGPIEVDYSVDDPKATSYAHAIFAQALEKADDEVDFSQYDNDHDGYIDMVYFIVPSTGSHADPDHPDHLWPHAWAFYYYQDMNLDEVKPMSYACSTEFLSEIYGIYDGVGTMCHEFSHVLGLPDLYDTDYEQHGQSNDPGNWNVMAGGPHNNYGRTPAGYSIYERYTLGFADIPVIDQEGSYTIYPQQTHNEGYIIKSPNEKEFFLLENRQTNTKWDAAIPGHGLLVWRLDSTDVNYWHSNKVNAYADHNCFECVSASGQKTRESQADPFPGSGMVTFLSSVTNPPLLTWDMKNCEFALENIAETDDVITFDIIKETNITVGEDIETFEGMEPTTEVITENVWGEYALWKFIKSAVVEVTDSTMGDGTRVAKFVNPSRIDMESDIHVRPLSISFDVTNTASTTAKFKLEYSPDGGENWAEADTYIVSGKDKKSIKYIVDGHYNSMRERLSLTGPHQVRIRLAMVAGHATKPCYVDNVQIGYLTNNFEKGDLNLDELVDVVDVTKLISLILDGGETPELRKYGDMNDDGELNVIDVTCLIKKVLGE
ncbi:MAG: M6 family metalloprotease domain-containing protein [Muribaculaceae bacterium]|nr:M6 family metalloprotease domain-containing protein [Muribaculaceae bacterium]